MTKTGAVGLLALLAGAPLLPAQAQAGAPDTARTRLIVELLNTTRTFDQVLTTMENAAHAQQQANPEIPEVFWERFLARARQGKDELFGFLVPIYAQALNEEDIRSLLQFYRSPAGMRFVAAMPTILTQSMQAGEQWGARLGAEVAAELQEEGLLP